MMISRTIYAFFNRPPNCNGEEFLKYLENLFSFVQDNNYKMVWEGDVNVNMLGDTVRKRAFCNLIKGNGTTNFIHVLTPVASTTKSIIDLFITNKEKNNIKAGVLGF